ncbi:MAG TPA: Ldh family oxidoreductase [Chloroflexota bacterium]|nr:Ldh family oxidoreductase [Chloroflexota bacterium]
MIVQSANYLREVSQRIFEGVGCPTDIAQRVADALVDANLAGHDSHGVIRIPQYVTAVRDGHVIADARPSLMRETAVTGLVDGHWAFGQLSAFYATEVAIAKAKVAGVSMVGIVRCNHIGRLGEYATMASDAGIAAIVTTSGFGGRGVSAAPFGGAKPVLGTNPIAVGLPAGVEPDVLVDFATTAVAAGKIEVARAKKTPLPPGSIVDREGRPTTDPEDYYNGGMLLPFGGHKGYSLSVVVEFLGRILTGADTFAEGTRGGPVYGHSGSLVIAMDPGVFVNPEQYAAAADETLHRLKSVPPAPGSSGVMIPGEPESRSRSERIEGGIPLAEDTWKAITNAARQVGVTIE